jgi:hypothetical protein
VIQPTYAAARVASDRIHRHLAIISRERNSPLSAQPRHLNPGRAEVGAESSVMTRMLGLGFSSGKSQ